MVKVPSLTKSMVTRAVKYPATNGHDCVRLCEQQCVQQREQPTKTFVLTSAAALIISLSVFTSFQALAVDENPQESGWYMGAAVGNVSGSRSVADYKDDLSDNGITVSNLTVDDSRTGWKLNIGFDVTQNVAIEAGYLDLKEVSLEGSAQVTDPEAFNNAAKTIHPNSADGFTLGSTYRYSISQNFGLTGSVGLFNWDGDFNTRALAAPQTDAGKDSTSGTDFYFGLGGGYEVFDDVTLSIEWERYKLDKEDAEVWSIGVDYHFR
ncbi:MAG: hypothetical protein ACI8WB_002417 [Phenylobacterium sp.]|jgi:hypothetical protein